MAENVVFAESQFPARPIAVVKISQVLLDRFCSNLQGLCKKVLSSDPCEKKICSFIYKKLMKNGVKIFKKISNTCHLPNKNASWFTR